MSPLYRYSVKETQLRFVRITFFLVLSSGLVSSTITIESDKRSGQPCVRGLRITVWDVLGWLAAGMTESEILDEYPELRQDDFLAVYGYAAQLGKRQVPGVILK
jgi:uncharacterized protein (DUF433 family)